MDNIMLTLTLEDHGQDFLEWDVSGGIVTACRPFQESFWKGTRVHNVIIVAGDTLEITTPYGPRTTLNYPVIKVRRH